MLKNVLIVVDDIEKSIEFYKDLFGLQVILKNEGNVILSEGLVLQDADVWGKTLKIIGRNVSWGIKDGLSLKSTVKSVLEMKL